MGLPPLEYIDCILDSPKFREIISLYEKELEDNAQSVISLVKECEHMIQATKEFSKAKKSFANVLENFTFQIIGEQTEDERMITQSLGTFSNLLSTIEDYRDRLVATISMRLLDTLEKFRKEQIQKAIDQKKQFDKATHSYYDALQRHLSVSTKKKDLTSQAEADSSLEREHSSYRQSALDYVCKLQDVHAQKQYELLEPIIGYVSDVSTFLHQSYDGAVSIKPELEAVQFKVQILRETHSEELEKAYQLKKQVIEEGEAGLAYHSDYLRQGNLFVQDNQKKGRTHWHKYFGQFRKRDVGGKRVRQIRFTPIGHQGNLPSQDFMVVKECVRTKTAESDRQFCFDLDLTSQDASEIHKYTVQAMSSRNRKGWLEIMDGKEPVYSSLNDVGSEIDDDGTAFVEKCITTIESRGLEEEGLYRKPGLISKATNLVKECIEKGKTDQINLSDEFEWDTKTIASAIKYYLSKHLREPLFTFPMHQQFIDVAKISDHEKRLCAIQELYEQLPAPNKKLIAIIIQHLSRVAGMSDRNLMKASNIGVCFGPTLMRPERESVASIVNIKYQNIIVEVMVENVEEIFHGGTGPYNNGKLRGGKYSSTSPTNVPTIQARGTTPRSRTTSLPTKPLVPPKPHGRGSNGMQ